jgi:GNAT superfamily N-acetyltransferase
MDFAIRPAAYGDAAAIAHVHVTSWKTTYVGIVPDTFLAALNSDVRAQEWQEHLAAATATTFVAEDNTGVFGFSCGGRIREQVGEYDGELYAIYLLRERQQQGVGRSLIQTLAVELRAAGMNSMLVWVLEANPAISFYERLGATKVAQKIIQIGGADLRELAFGWPTLDRLA